MLGLGTMAVSAASGRRTLSSSVGSSLRLTSSRNSATYGAVKHDRRSYWQHMRKDKLVGSVPLSRDAPKTAAMRDHSCTGHGMAKARQAGCIRMGTSRKNAQDVRVRPRETQMSTDIAGNRSAIYLCLGTKATDSKTRMHTTLRDGNMSIAYCQCLERRVSSCCLTTSCSAELCRGWWVKRER